MPPRLRSCLFAWLILVLAQAWAGGPPMPTGRFSFRSYGSEQGLGNLAAGNMLQDRRGFLWVGTEDGLYRYDGSRFQNFGMHEGLPSSFITALHEDPAGGLWVGTYQGLGCWTGQGFAAVAEGRGLPVENILGLGDGPEGRIWVATSKGPYALQEDGSFRLVGGWPGGEATALFGRPGSGRIWVGAWVESGPRKEAQVLQYRDGAWKRWEDPSGFGRQRLDALLEDHEGALWARGPRRLWVLHPGQEGFKDGHPGVFPISARAYLSLDRAGNLYVPTDRGIQYLDHGTWKLLAQRDGLPVPWARWVLEDREGSLWVASLGVHRLLGRGLWRAYTGREGLPSEMVWTLHRDPQRAFYAGTDRGLARAEAGGWSILPGTENNVVRSVVQAPDGTFYLGGVPVEVLRYDPRTRQVDGRFGLESGLNGKRIFRMALDREGTLWVATEGGGLQRARVAERDLRFRSEVLPGGAVNEYVSGICLGGSGRLWVCGERGLALREQGKWTRFTERDGLLRTHVAYAIEARNGDLLVAYFEAQGFSRVRVENGRLKVVAHPGPSDPTGREKVYMLGEDSRSRVWVGTGQGVFVSQGDRMEHFGQSEGLVGEDISNMAFLSDPAGDVWIGTSSGLARFDAASYQGQPPPPASVILVSRLGDRAFPPETEPRVPHGQNAFEVNFAGLSFLGEGRVQHEVRLLNLETEWHRTSTREARFPALSPGRYVFEVRSRVGDQGEWGPEARVAFTVLPAWWQTWWSRLLLVGALAGLVVLLIRWRLRALQEQNRALEALVAARTQELEAANDALRNQSLTDPLTGLRNRRYLGVCMPEDVARVQRAHRQVPSGQKERLNLNIDLIFIMVDVDHFKSINDTYGHHAGDLVLQQLAEILRKATRDTDTVVRWGGEEFLVVARNANRKEAAILAERIRSQVEAHPFHLGGGQTLHRTCSMGYAFFPFLPEHPDFLGWEPVVDVADHCLYAAKRSGRNGWVGVSSRPQPDPIRFGESVSLHLPDFIREGSLDLMTSFPDPGALDWELRP